MHPNDGQHWKKRIIDSNQKYQVSGVKTGWYFLDDMITVQRKSLTLKWLIVSLSMHVHELKNKNIENHLKPADAIGCYCFN